MSGCHRLVTLPVGPVGRRIAGGLETCRRWRILTTRVGACHVTSGRTKGTATTRGGRPSAQAAVVWRKTSFHHCGRFGGEWSRPNEVLQFLWSYFFVMSGNFPCRRGYEGQLLVRECQLLRDVLGGVFQTWATAEFFIDTSDSSVNVRAMVKRRVQFSVFGFQWEGEPNR